MSIHLYISTSLHPLKEFIEDGLQIDEETEDDSQNTNNFLKLELECGKMTWITNIVIIKLLIINSKLVKNYLIDYIYCNIRNSILKYPIIKDKCS